MLKEQLMGRLLEATPEEMRKIEAVFTGQVTALPETANTKDRRLFTLTAAAKELNVSRMTVHRMCADGRLPTIETRLGRRRIPSAAITAFIKGKGEDHA